MALGQLVSMGALIFSIYDWNIMEPVTYMVSTFYTAVGAWFYLWYRQDFEYTGVFDMFY